MAAAAAARQKKGQQISSFALYAQKVLISIFRSLVSLFCQQKVSLEENDKKSAQENS